MALDKNLLAGGTCMLLLKLLQRRDMYGYEMIETLRMQSNDTFSLKAGTLYPLLHMMEEKGYVSSYEEQADSGRARKYYHLTDSGHDALARKLSEWNEFSAAVGRVLEGGASV